MCLPFFHLRMQSLFLKHHMPFKILEVDEVQKPSCLNCNMSSESSTVWPRFSLLYQRECELIQHTDIYDKGKRYFLHICDHTYKLSITSGGPPISINQFSIFSDWYTKQLCQQLPTSCLNNHKTDWQWACIQTCTKYKGLSNTITHV